MAMLNGRGYLLGPLRLLRTYLPGPLWFLRTYLPGPLPSVKNLFAGTLLSFGKDQLICSAMEGKHCGLGSIIIFNANPYKLVHYLLHMMNTY